MHSHTHTLTSKKCISILNSVFSPGYKTISMLGFILIISMPMCQQYCNFLYIDMSIQSSCIVYQNWKWGGYLTKFGSNHYSHPFVPKPQITFPFQFLFSFFFSISPNIFLSNYYLLSYARHDFSFSLYLLLLYLPPHHNNFLLFFLCLFFLIFFYSLLLAQSD